MNDSQLVDKTSYIVAFLFFIFSLFLFYSDTGMLVDSAVAAAIAAALIWAVYVMLRLCILAFRR